MYLPKKLIFWLAVVLAGYCLAFTLLGKSYCLGDFFNFYSKNIRPSAFTAFLTVSIFLLSLKTFIVTTMKANVYDDSRYLQKFLEKKSSKPEAILTKMVHIPLTEKFETISKPKRDYQNRDLYFPLKNLSDALFIAIIISFVASVIQFTFGFVESYFTLFFALLFPVLSVTMLVHCLLKISENITQFLAKDDKPLEEQAKANPRNDTLAPEKTDEH